MPGGVGSPTGNPLSALEMTRLALFKMYNQQAAAASGGGGGPIGPGGPGGAPQVDVGRAMAEQQARAALAAAAARENDNKENAAVGVNHQGHRRHGPQDNNLDVAEDDAPATAAAEVGGVAASKMAAPRDDEASCSPPPMKRERRVSRPSEERRRTYARSPVGNSGVGANIRISSRGKSTRRRSTKPCPLSLLFLPFPGDSGDSSLVVSLEINSVMYQGVLFAQPKSDKAASGHFPTSTSSATAAAAAAVAAASSSSSPAVSPTAITMTNAAASATEGANQNNGGGTERPLSHEART